MKKETFYFSHDYASRADEKIKKLIYKHGMEGYGIYWAIIEDLYQNDNKLEADYDMLAYDLRCTKNLYKSVVEDFGLFVLESNTLYSISIQKRLQIRESKSNRGKASAEKRWVGDKVAMQPDDVPNAIKERKGKDIRVNIDSNKLLEFYNDITGKKAKVVSEKVKKQLRARLKEGYTKSDIITALKNAAKDQLHIDNNYKYLTLEFITRADKLDRFLNMEDFKIKRKVL